MDTTVSIVIPLFNGEATITQAIASVTSRFRNYEIVVVDDCSTDASREIIAKLCAANNAIHLTCSAENQGPFAARKHGALKATGEYVLFLDADDAFLPGAYDAILAGVENGEDIVHFGISCIPENGANARDAKNLERWLTPLQGRLEGSDVLQACLLEKRYCWNLCGKAIRREICTQAFSLCPDSRFMRAEDLLAYLFCASFAASYRGIPESVIYRYRYGAGTEGTHGLPFSRFQTYWQNHPNLLHAFEDFLESRNAETERAKIYVGALANILENDTVQGIALSQEVRRDKALNAVPVDDLSRHYELIRANWGTARTTLIAQEAFRERQLFGPYAARNANFMQQKACANARGDSTAPANVAIICERAITPADFGHLERIARHFRQNGSPVTLLSNDRKAYDFFAKTTVDANSFLIQPRANLSARNCEDANRFDYYAAFSDLLDSHSIDLAVILGWADSQTCWDMLFIKASGISVILDADCPGSMCHENPREYFGGHAYTVSLCNDILYDEHDDGNVCITPNKHYGNPTAGLLKTCREISLRAKAGAPIPEKLQQQLQAKARKL